MAFLEKNVLKIIVKVQVVAERKEIDIKSRAFTNVERK